MYGALQSIKSLGSERSFSCAESGRINDERRRSSWITGLAARAAARDWAPDLPQIKSENDLQSCFLVLEHAHELPSGPKGCPSVKAWCEDDCGKVVGSEAQWKGRTVTDAPTWYSARSLGVLQKEVGRLVLRLEIWSRSEIVAWLSVPMKNIQFGNLTTLDLNVSKQQYEGRSAIAFQMVEGTSILKPKTIFFIRHGESRWNSAQSSWNVYELLRMQDHPLSDRGRQQCEILGERLSAPGEDSTACSIAGADAIYVSPLTRAIQTAAIAFQKVFAAADAPTDLVLMANAREKKNFGGKDSSSSSMGADILQRAIDELRRLYGAKDHDVVTSLRKVRFDTLEVEKEWWHRGRRETAEQLEHRLDEFMFQLLYSPHETIVVVGHSHFFRAVFARYLSRCFHEERPDMAKELTKKKLQNCGVARLTLDPSAVDDGPIVEADLVLDTKFVAGHGFLKNFTTTVMQRLRKSKSQSE
eukprot:TRINITY_DN50915_c0_g1_i1.p1 TRINITY_DN50915_c0_g1~~TRINITY_DN50915_c0_g1_i1.p1  ORF type:complete len:471 (+),score=82.50 TRINITY_DN50915_c0_g1_i1:113-1525(+)